VRRLGLLLLLVAALDAGAQDAMSVVPCRMDGADCLTFDRVVAPSGCISTSVPFFGVDLKLTCDAGLTYDAATDTLSVTYGSTGIAVVTKTATGNVSATEARGTQISNYGQAAETTLTLPAAAAGLNFVVAVGTAGAGALHVKAGASDKLYLDGVALDDGDKASLATPAVGQTLTCLAVQTGASAWDWTCTSGGGSTWTDGGA